jgi:hypothetical protein
VRWIDLFGMIRLWAGLGFLPSSPIDEATAKGHVRQAKQMAHVVELHFVKARAKPQVQLLRDIAGVHVAAQLGKIAKHLPRSPTKAFSASFDEQVLRVGVTAIETCEQIADLGGGIGRGLHRANSARRAPMATTGDWFLRNFASEFFFLGQKERDAR